MSKAYNPDEIELKWQKKWEEAHCFEAEASHEKPKFYALIEFPYPSGAGLHVGHPRCNTAMDIIARKRRMEGYNVLFPIGWDAFGLPTENYAIKNHVHPAERDAEEHRPLPRAAQAHRLLLRLDARGQHHRSRATYKWTQWIFLQLYQAGPGLQDRNARQLVHQLQVRPGQRRGRRRRVRALRRARSSASVKSQWMLKITAYAQKLLDGLDDVDFIDKVKVQQRNWIGRSEGAEVDFAIKDTDEKLRVYTTRPDTLFGATYMVVAPEHPTDR